jgi:anionic cell wall polymer biosynthesis LytR-Cps2A-Psr (LCP) family protein
MMVTLDTRARRLMLITYMREMLVQRPTGKSAASPTSPKTMGRGAVPHHQHAFWRQGRKYILFSMDNVQTIIDALGGVYITVTDAEADNLNRYRIARDATTPSMDKAGTYRLAGMRRSSTCASAKWAATGTRAAPAACARCFPRWRGATPP